MTHLAKEIKEFPEGEESYFSFANKIVLPTAKKVTFLRTKGHYCKSNFTPQTPIPNNNQEVNSYFFGEIGG